MKPDWDRLSSEYSDSKVVVVADVDCTVHQGLCSEHGVRGYPTIKYFLGGDAEDYKGGRSYDDLKKFVEGNLMDPACDSNNKESCSPEQLPLLEEAMAMSAEDRKAKIDSMTAEIKAAEKAHEDLLQSLQAQYKKSMEDTEAKVAETKKEMKWLKAVKDAPAGDKKDEL